MDINYLSKGRNWNEEENYEYLDVWVLGKVLIKVNIGGKVMKLLI